MISKEKEKKGKKKQAQMHILCEWTKTGYSQRGKQVQKGPNMFKIC